MNPQPNYRVYDLLGGATEDIVAESIDDAIQQGRDWIEAGDWDNDDSGPETISLHCVVRAIVRDADGHIDDEATEDGEEFDCTGEHTTPEPPCEVRSEHDWRTPHALVGGLEDDPGTYSLGGTRWQFKSVCSYCGMYRTITDNGKDAFIDQPKASYVFEPADEASLRWVAELKAP